MEIFALKIIITIIAVSALTIIAERISPRAAGILSGYPLGSAISLFFIGLEQGADFAGTSAVYNVAGLFALQSFYFTYYLVSNRVSRFSVLLSSLAAIAGFLAVDAVLQGLHLPPWACLVIGIGAVPGFGFLYRRIPNASITRRVHLGLGVVIFRAALAALVILSITGAAHLVPPSWAGLFSAFPSTVFPLLLILHTTYGREQAHTVIKHVPSGQWSLVLYLLAVSAAYPLVGIYWGTLAGFAAATLYLLAFAAFMRRSGQPRAVEEQEEALL